MYELMIEGEFSAAHHLKGYQGKCEELHGHNWKVQVFVIGERLNKTGMLLDFKEITLHLKNILKPLDHCYLNETPPFNKLNPTSENLARFIFKKLKKGFTTTRFQISKVTVWETDRAFAAYSEP